MQQGNERERLGKGGGDGNRARENKSDRQKRESEDDESQVDTAGGKKAVRACRDHVHGTTWRRWESPRRKEQRECFALQR